MIGDPKDVFFFDPGEKEKVYCPTCNEKMLVKRDCDGPTSWVGAMSGTKRKHDQFYCKNNEKGWHIQAKKLMKLIDETPSLFIKKELERELEFIIYHKEATLEKFGDK